MYRKNAAGLIEKRGQPHVQLKGLPGVTEDLQEPPPFNVFDHEDSDDALEAGLIRKEIPKTRPREGCCFKMKQLDIYGVEPGMVIEGRPKFKSCWGVFFSIFTILSVLYYLGMKMIFLYVNRTS